MPELAEIETVRRNIEKTLKNKKIEDVVLDDKDRWLYAFTTPKEVQKALKGAKITGTGRKGKYFWLELDKKPWPILHLGMSGNISILEPQKKSGHRRAWGGEKLWSDVKDEREKLWHCRLLLIFKDGSELAFTDPRRFGRLWLADDPWEHPRIKKLGYDPLLDFPTSKVLEERIKKRKKPIKVLLLDQSIFAGVGNWLADEILYQAKISPHRLASDLKSSEIKNLHKQILAIVRKAVTLSADYDRYPKNWIFHHRWGKSKNAYTSRKQKIRHEDIGGRTSAWVPGWQR